MVPLQPVGAYAFRRRIPNTLSAGFFTRSRSVASPWEKEWFPHEPIAKVSQYMPYAVRVKAREIYHWCSCGESQTQPWIDGNCKCSKHEDGFRPRLYTTNKDGVRLLCGCKSCFDRPVFDGTCWIKFCNDFPQQGALYLFAVGFSLSTLVSYYWHP